MTEESTSAGVTPIGNGPASGSGAPSAGGPVPPSPAGPRPDLRGVTFLTVAEVATLMRVSKMSVYRLIHAGELEAVRFGRSFRVPESAVNAYLRDAFFETG